MRVPQRVLVEHPALVNLDLVLTAKIETDPHAPRSIHTVHRIGHRFSVEEST